MRKLPAHLIVTVPAKEDLEWLISKYDVLVVEDREPARMLFVEKLEEYGIICFEAANVSEAENIIANAKKKLLILLDLNLGNDDGTGSDNKSGADLIEYIRNEKIDVKVILISASIYFGTPNEGMGVTGEGESIIAYAMDKVAILYNNEYLLNVLINVSKGLNCK